MNEIEIKRQLNKYTEIISKLKKNGIIRTSKVVGDYGEYIACKKLKFDLVINSVNKGYDATDSKGKKYEIKARKTSYSKPTVFIISKTQLKVADFIVYVHFDNKWNVEFILKIPTKKIVLDKYNRVNISKDLIKKYSV